MFGTFRLILALVVVVGHLRGPWWIGTYAVFGFYTLSGYLMCLVMNERYGYTSGGIRAFFCNRILRIYPPYWTAALLTLALSLWIDEGTISQFKSHLLPPVEAGEWLVNVFIFGLTMDVEHRLVPPAWALYVELVYYTLIGLFLGRNARTVKVWFVCSLLYHLYLAVSGQPWRERYFPLAAASLPFSIGGLFYFCRAGLANLVRRPNMWLLPAVAAYLANYLAALYLGKGLSVFFFYLSLVLTAAIIVLLMQPLSWPVSMQALDRFCGDLSYPIYLSHWQAGLVVAAVFRLEKGNALLLAALPLVFLTAWTIKVAVEDQVERLRNIVKRNLPSQPQRGAVAMR